jgi:mono/diheme cytochrome c family protein
MALQLTARMPATQDSDGRTSNKVRGHQPAASIAPLYERPAIGSSVPMNRFVASLALVCLVSWLDAQQPAPANIEVPIGSTVDARFTDLRWQRRRLRELEAKTATVLYFATIGCPIVTRYMPRIEAMAREYESRGIVFLVVNVGVGDDLVAAAAQVTRMAPAATFAKDFTGAVMRACGVERTATCVVLDANQKLVYRGRVDDQHAYISSRTEAKHHELRDAIEDVLASREVAIAESEVSGCLITNAADIAAATAHNGAPTYHQDVLPVMQRHCQECHRPNGQAPFELMTEPQVKQHAAMIAEVVTQGRMPPWYASEDGNTFHNYRGLSAAERTTIRAWAAGGMPSGNASEAPAAVVWPETAWRIGEPDLVLEIKTPIRLPADGVLPYRYFVLPFHFTEETWVEAIEIQPKNGRSLHHCNLARVKLGERFSQDGFVTGYVPGGDAMVLDPGTAVRIPAGSALALQAHYVTTGEPEVDRLRVGLRFPRVRVQKELQVAICANFRFEIPPGARAHPVRTSRTFDRDAIGLGMVVHMHLRGRDMQVTAKNPDGSEERLLTVPNYNFDWQQSYRWPAAGKHFAKGTRIQALAHFDNSEFNPFNPDATVPIRFGLATTDEMMYAFLFWFGEHEQLDLAVDPTTGHVVEDKH